MTLFIHIFCIQHWHGVVLYSQILRKYKQNRAMFLCCYLWKKKTKSALSLLNVYFILNINNVYGIYALKFIYLWHIRQSAN